MRYLCRPPLYAPMRGPLLLCGVSFLLQHAIAAFPFFTASPASSSSSSTNLWAKLEAHGRGGGHPPGTALRRKLMSSCYETEIRELPPSKQRGALKCCCVHDTCPDDPVCEGAVKGVAAGFFLLAFWLPA